MKNERDIMLKDLLNWPAIMVQPRYGGSHQDIMENLFTNCAILASYIESDYQGELGYIYLVYFGTDYAKVAIITDYFGSCSGCDAWDGADDDDARDLCIALANNARLFDTIDEAKEYLETCDKATSWGIASVASGLLESLEETRKQMSEEDFRAFRNA
jgi:hypothetical protein